MPTQDEIAKLAREYVADVYGGDADFIDEAESVISWLLRAHCIVSKENVKEEYQKAQTQIKDGKELGIHVLVTSGGAKEALLESLFDAETFKNSEV